MKPALPPACTTCTLPAQQLLLEKMAGSLCLT